MSNVMGDMYWICIYNIYIQQKDIQLMKEISRMAYFGKSFYFKKLHNEGGSLGISVECGDLR